MRLDFLQNHPTNPRANELLTSPILPNLSSINPKDYAQAQQDGKKLAQIFGGESSVPFGFLCGDWLELFLRLQSFQVASAISIHQQGYEALKLLKFPIEKIIPDKKSGLIDETIILDAIQKKCQCFILPLVNEDILTQNPIKTIKSILKKHLKNFILIIDISYAVALNIFLPDILDEQTLFLLNGESIGILRGHGAIIAKNFSHPEIFPKTPLTPKLFESFIIAINDLPKTPQDNKIMFYHHLKEKLKDDLSVFAPLENTLPNCLPLRFTSIKARNLLQALLLQKIYAINGAECLYGFFAPSFVLQEMGYLETEARELLSLSYEQLKNPEQLSEILTRTYRQIKALQI